MPHCAALTVIKALYFFVFLRQLLLLSPAGVGDMCEELWSQIPCPGGQQRFHRWCYGQNHFTQVKSSNHCTRQSVVTHTGIGWPIFLKKKRRKKKRRSVVFSGLFISDLEGGDCMFLA